jgi:hypothetical protein
MPHHMHDRDASYDVIDIHVTTGVRKVWRLGSVVSARATAHILGVRACNNRACRYVTTLARLQHMLAPRYYELCLHKQFPKQSAATGPCLCMRTR